MYVCMERTNSANEFELFYSFCRERILISIKKSLTLIVENVKVKLSAIHL